MNLSYETNRRFGGDRQKTVAQEKIEPPTRGEYVLIETDITDLAQASSRIEALRSLILIFLREVDSLKRVVGPRARKKADPIKLEREMDAFEASLIRDARFEIIAGAGHIPCVEQPDALVSLVGGFIASLPGRER